jgi:class 3 adenylate cyclase
VAIADAVVTLGLDLHMGLHTGECEVRGNDLGGLAVHIAARVGALAVPGEVLVSGTGRDLVVGSGIEFDERGEHDPRACLECGSSTPSLGDRPVGKDAEWSPVSLNPAGYGLSQGRPPAS